MENKSKKRLDILLVERGLAETRSRAQDLIERGFVQASCGGKLTKPGQSVPPDIEITLTSAQKWVSRAAEKLEQAIREFNINPQGLTCLDVGASTGGFSEVLLENGAAKVYAVDVGHGQLHEKIRADKKVVVLEKTNSKDLSRELIPDKIDLVVCDVSFISLEKALPAALVLGKELVALIKPQFEVGKENIRDGVVKDEALHKSACENVRRWLESEGWKVLAITDSPILGKEGNKEFLLHAVKEKK